MDSHTALGLGRVPDAEAARRGEPIFVQNCQACHGEGARGGIGPNLVRSVLVLHDDSGEALTQVIHSGRPQSGMPPFPQITDAQAHDLSEYLHQMIELAANRGLYTNASTMASGNADRGKAFFAAHCASCHSATGDLAKVATTYSDPPTLMTRIIWPQPKGARKATVTTPDGKTLEGTLAHYDDFDTTLKLADGTTESWETGTVKVSAPDPIAGHTALLPVYSDDDLHDLTRYLMTLRDTK